MPTKEVETNLEQYAELRTILDSVEIGALRFYLNATSQAEQQANFKYLKTALMKISDRVWERKKGIAIDCPDGYIECNGCCVPYKCVNRG